MGKVNMKIERLELFGYIRLTLKNVQHFIFTPESPHQIILGRNGSGKSSIVHELSPLPPVKEQYTTNGFKKITLTHRGSRYQLDSVIKNNRHSFVKDGEELNPGGTVTVQRELVRREFNYWLDLHELMVGQKRLTRMATNERREWCTLLDALDFTVALGYYKKIKTLARDHQGTLKHLRHRLTQETNTLKQLDAEEGIEVRGEQLGQELNVLLRERIPHVPTVQTLDQKMRGLLERIGQCSTQFLKQQMNLPTGFHFSNHKEIRDELIGLEQALNTAQSLLVRSTSEYNELETIVHELSKDTSLTFENLSDHIATCEQQIQHTRSELGVFHNLIDADIIQRDTEQILDLVMSIFSQLPDNEDRRYSRESAEQAKYRIREHDKVISRSSLRIEQIKIRIQHMNAAKDTTCPQCRYVWREGFSEHELKQNEVWLDEHQVIIKAERERIRKEEAFLEESDHYAGLYTQFRGYTMNYPRLEPLWQHLLQNGLLLKQPALQQVVFHQWRKDVAIFVQIQEQERKLKHLIELAQRQPAMDGNVHFTQRFTRLQGEVEELTVSTTKLLTETKTLRTYEERVSRLFDLTHQIELAVNELDQSYSQHINALKNHHIDQVVRQHQLELASITHRVNEKRVVEGVVLDLESSEHTVNLNHQAYTLICRALSPEDGLIADQLRCFVGCLVAQLNAVINSIWTYSMEILPCGLDSGDLDYKFPIRVENSDNLIPDIDKGSTSMQWIIDMAFKLTVMLYLNMEDYPLCLDEPGDGFDPQHNVNLVGFVKQLMDSGRYSQLFMVSHFDAFHGAFTNAQVVVLDTANIAVPNVYNEHVVLN